MIKTQQIIIFTGIKDKLINDIAASWSLNVHVCIVDVIINESSGAFILNQGGGGRCGEGLFEGGGVQSIRTRIL